MRFSSLLLIIPLSLGPATVDAQVVVESKAPQWTRQTAWSVDTRPMLEIGLVDGAQPYLFDRVMGVTRFPDGRIAVATMGGSDIRFFNASGRHIRSVGGHGEGPSEFTQVMGMTRGRGDSLYVHDGRLGTKVFSPTGNYARLISESREPPYADYTGIFDDGTVLALNFPQGDRSKQTAGSWVENAEIYAIGADGRTKKKVADLPAAEFGARGGSPNYVQFGIPIRITVGRNRFYYQFGDAFRITEYAMTGQPLRTLVRPWTPAPVTRSDIEAFETSMLNAPDESGRHSPELRATRARYIAGVTYARNYSAVMSIKEDTEGNVWVRHNQQQKYSGAGAGGWGPVPLTPTRWSVFAGTTGAWLGEIETPARFNVREIGSDYIAGVARDEMDVEFVRVYRLNKPRR